MDLDAFVQSVKEDRTLRIDITEHRYLPPREAVYADIELEPRLREALTAQGIERFFVHQAHALDAVRNGENVIAMTPTGSGKSLIYNIPVLESVLADPEARALYIFPLKGLEQDQFGTLDTLGTALGLKNLCAVYDGDTTQYRRRKIRENMPNVVFTNPDMLHYAINAFHPKWEDFFRNLRYVVIDEIHAYRGVFGSSVAQIIRRLRRIAHRWGSAPQFIACSATIANPGAFTQELTGLPFTVIERGGSPRGGVHFMFADPMESPYTASTRLLIKCLGADLRTIAFTRARKITELIYSWAVDQVPELRDILSPYRAGFLPAERRDIEQRLFNGELKGVVSTSALELGVDIGGLDVCILVGYPGSISSTWQRAGRVGRRGGDSLVIMVALADALDHYLMRHPDEFFGKSHEAAVVDPSNPDILKAHLPCAAKELSLREDDTVYDIAALRPVIDELLTEGGLVPGRQGGLWLPKNWAPHREVQIRTVGPSFAIFEGKRKVGELSGYRVLREAFPGAIYLHRGRQYRVEELDIEGGRVRAREADVDYYTQALTSEETDVLGEGGSTGFELFSVHEGRLSIRHQVTGYEKKRIWDRETIDTYDLNMPEYIFETEGLWFRIDERLMREAETRGYHVGGTLHAFEHASISCVPLFALCDKNDLGGISYDIYPPYRQSTIFIYDGHEGGVGLSHHVFGVLHDWLDATLDVITACPCEEGCPSCVQDSMCGNANSPLDKEGAAWLTGKLLESVA